MLNLSTFGNGASLVNLKTGLVSVSDMLGVQRDNLHALRTLFCKKHISLRHMTSHCRSTKSGRSSGVPPCRLPE